MKKQLLTVVLVLFLTALTVFAACAGNEDDSDDDSAGDDTGDDDTGDGQLDISVCDPSNGPFSADVTNPYFPVIPGMQAVLEGTEDGETLRVEITVLDETEEVAGVATRVYEERESADGVLVEISHNFFAQAPDGAVCYYGEDVDIYENDVVVAHEGAWRAGEGENKPGIQMPADPEVGMSYDQEVAPGVAEDHGEITSKGDTITVPFGTYEDTLTIDETSGLESGTSLKQYAKDIGMIVDETIMLVSFTPAP